MAIPQFWEIGKILKHIWFFLFIQYLINKKSIQQLKHFICFRLDYLHKSFQLNSTN